MVGCCRELEAAECESFFLFFFLSLYGRTISNPPVISASYEEQETVQTHPYTLLFLLFRGSIHPQGF